MRSHVVSRATCAEVARASASGSASSSMRLPPRRTRSSSGFRATATCSRRCIEAALGAIFLQHGFAAVEDAVVDAFADQIEHALTSRVDHKTDLQELLARTSRQVVYTEISVEGPPHERRFTCAAVIDGEELGRGEGQTKKAAEQEAAREALAKLDAAEL